MCGNTKKVVAKPSSAEISVPMAICIASFAGFGAAEASAETATALSAKVLPLGQAVEIQKLPNSRIIIPVRIPATAAPTALARGAKTPSHCSRWWRCAASEAWVWA
ncbi:hypothetical protein D9M71_80190 [compost metagenome]